MRAVVKIKIKEVNLLKPILKVKHSTRTFGDMGSGNVGTL